MKLKKIKAFGFKTFAEADVARILGRHYGDRRSERFGQVEPGRRVSLGARRDVEPQLRSGKLEDVIFVGNEKRKPLGLAEVSMTFDNEDRKLPIDFNEVEITRRAYRAGESEYFINRSQVRLRDIIELLMGTGLGPGSYSIVSQGQIDAILTSKPTERRALFEETAGINKFLARKNESMRRLEQTEKNAIRINDLIAEIERRIPELETQVRRAKRYRKVSARVRDLEILSYMRASASRRANAKRCASNSRNKKKCAALPRRASRTLGAKLAEMRTRAYQQELQLEELRVAGAEQARRAGAHRSRLRRGARAPRSARSAIDADLRRRRARRSGARFAGSVDRAFGRAPCAARARDSSRRANASCRRRRRSRRRARSSTDLHAAARSRSDRGRTSPRRRPSVACRRESARRIRAARGRAARRARAHRATRDRRRFGDPALCRTRTRSSVRSSAACASARERRDGRSAPSCGTRLNSRARLPRTATNRRSQGCRIAPAHDRRAGSVARRTRAGHARRRRSVAARRAARHRRHRFEPDHDRRTLCARDGHRVRRAPLEHHHEHLRRRGACDRISNAHESGRATFLPLDTLAAREAAHDDRSAFHAGVIGYAHTLVRTEPKYEGVVPFLVGNVLIVDTLQTGIALVRGRGFRDTIVTLEGEQITGGGAITGGRFRRERSILGRRVQAQTLRETLAECARSLEQLERDAQTRYARRSRGCGARCGSRSARGVEAASRRAARGDGRARSDSNACRASSTAARERVAELVAQAQNARHASATWTRRNPTRCAAMKSAGASKANWRGRARRSPKRSARRAK